MKSKKYDQRRINATYDAPENDVIVANLNYIHVVLFGAKRLKQPKANVN